MPVIAEAPQEGSQKITVRSAMNDQSYLRCVLHLYNQQIFLIGEKIFLPQLNKTVSALSPEFLVVLTSNEIIHVRHDKLLNLPKKFEFRNSSRWS